MGDARRHCWRLRRSWHARLSVGSRRSADWARVLTPSRVPVFIFLPVALPLCVWIIRTFAADARGHGTEAVIAAVHQRAGRVDWLVAPVKLSATVVTLAFGGSVGKEGPAAQIGAALTSLFADILRLRDEDRRRLVICGISAGFAAVFGTPVSGALFGIEVLYLGRIDYTVIFPALVAGIVAHLVCGVRPPFPSLQDALRRYPPGEDHPDHAGVRRAVRADRAAAHRVAAFLRAGAASLRTPAVPAGRRGRRGAGALVFAAGDAYAGLGTDTINGMLAGTTPVSPAHSCSRSWQPHHAGNGRQRRHCDADFLRRRHQWRRTGAAVRHAGPFLGAVGLVAMLAAAANTPIAAAVMAMELLPGPEGVYAALAASTAFLMVGHRSVYASQKIGLSKSAGLDVELGGAIGDVNRDPCGSAKAV